MSLKYVVCVVTCICFTNYVFVNQNPQRFVTWYKYMKTVTMMTNSLHVSCKIVHHLNWKRCFLVGGREEFVLWNIFRVSSDKRRVKNCFVVFHTLRSLSFTSHLWLRKVLVKFSFLNTRRVHSTWFGWILERVLMRKNREGYG